MISTTRTVTALTVAAFGLLVAGCGSAPAPAPAADPAPQTTLEVEGVLASDPAGDAITYDPASAPEGARFTASVAPGGESTVFTFAVEGMLPDRGYAVHAHTMPCGPSGDDAGPHFQHMPDPVKPSVDPAYANPTNEVWLDLTTDAQGAGMSTVDAPFAFAGSAPKSIIVHEAAATATAAGEAGKAGARLACLDLPVEA